MQVHIDLLKRLLVVLRYSTTLHRLMMTGFDASEATVSERLPLKDAHALDFLAAGGPSSGRSYATWPLLQVLKGGLGWDIPTRCLLQKCLLVDCKTGRLLVARLVLDRILPDSYRGAPWLLSICRS